MNIFILFTLTLIAVLLVRILKQLVKIHDFQFIHKEYHEDCQEFALDESGAIRDFLGTIESNILVSQNDSFHKMSMDARKLESNLVEKIDLDARTLAELSTQQAKEISESIALNHNYLNNLVEKSTSGILVSLESVVKDILEHVKQSEHKIKDKVNSESDEIKKFINYQHDTSVNNHSNADKKIEAVFQRVNSQLAIKQRIPSM